MEPIKQLDCSLDYPQLPRAASAPLGANVSIPATIWISDHSSDEESTENDAIEESEHLPEEIFTMEQASFANSPNLSVGIASAAQLASTTPLSATLHLQLPKRHASDQPSPKAPKPNSPPPLLGSQSKSLPEPPSRSAAPSWGKDLAWWQQQKSYAQASSSKPAKTLPPGGLQLALRSMLAAQERSDLSKRPAAQSPEKST